MKRPVSPRSARPKKSKVSASSGGGNSGAPVPAPPLSKAKLRSMNETLRFIYRHGTPDDLRRLRKDLNRIVVGGPRDQMRADLSRIIGAELEPIEAVIKGQRECQFHENARDGKRWISNRAGLVARLPNARPRFYARAKARAAVRHRASLGPA